MNNYLLASIAVFKNLKDKDSDIYHVIGEFIKDIFLQNHTAMDIVSLKKELNQNYGFNIPEAVIKTALNRLKPKKRDGKFLLELEQDKPNLQTQISNYSCIHYELINDIKLFIKSNNENKTINIDDNEIYESLQSYILDGEVNKDNPHIIHIAAFIITHKDNEKYSSILNQLRDGYILLTGLSYQTNSNEIYNFQNDLVLFLDTEILFNSIGYNGNLYKDIFNDDFIPLINEINNKNKVKKNNKSKIYLKYLEQTKDEINNFFNAAESILRNSTLVENNPAMEEILKGCRSPSDIYEKKVKFFNHLKKLNIEELVTNISITKSENYCFNVDSNSIRTNFLKANNELEERKFDEYIEILNILNILRKGNSHTSLENSKYLFITGTSMLIKLAWEPKIKHNGEVPLVSDLRFIINRFWFKLQKPLSNDSQPKSFQLATKAKIILSSLFGDNLSFQLNRIKEKVELGQITKEDALDLVVSLREEKYYLPENIDSVDSVEDTLFWLNENALERALLEKKYEQDKRDKILKENEHLKKENTKFHEKEKMDQTKKEKNKTNFKRLLIVILVLFLLILICYAIYKLYLYKEEIGYILGILSSLIPIIKHKWLKKIWHKIW